MLAIPSKLADKQPEWSAALKHYVKINYNKSLAHAHAQAFNTVDAHRRDAAPQAQPTVPRAPELVGAIRRYEHLLAAIEGRFDVSQLQIGFAWRDAFKPYVKQTEADTSFERVALRFNLAALLSFSAINQNRKEADSQP